MKNFGGKILFLDRSDINTDEIIPAKYLNELTKEDLKPHILEDLRLDGFNVNKDVKDKTVIITRANFGCGSSREHAAWVFECNNLNLVIASNFARIFRQNFFNCGMMAAEVSEAQIDAIFEKYSNTDAVAEVDLDRKKIKIFNQANSDTYEFKIGGFEEALIRTEGWLGFTDTKY